MISISQALETVSNQEVARSTITVSVQKALGHYLSAPIVSSMDLPSFDNSAMDGYAICGYEEMYQVIGEVAAGDTSSKVLKEGEAIRIFTGGKVPENATAVIMQEKVQVKAKLLNVKDDVLKGKNIRLKGSELKEGMTVFEPGQKITPAAVATLCSLGLTDVEVFAKPKVHVITTGNELVEPGKPIKEGQIYESNGATLSAALDQTGFSCDHLESIKDDFDAIKWSIGERLEECDVLLISGGISVGEYDFVKKALEENGVEELYYKVAQKPGKPLFFGRKGDTYVFALPGNPGSALTCFYVHVLPLLNKLAGGACKGLTRIKLPLEEAYHMKSDRATFFKAILCNGEVQIMQGQSSAMLHAMALGNAIVLLDEMKLYEKGAMVDTYLLP